MIEIKPKTYNFFSFQDCAPKEVKVEQIIFYGMHVLAQCSCPKNSQHFYCTFPIGHALEYPVAFSANGQEKAYSANAKLWLAEPLIQHFLNEKPVAAPLEKIVLQPEKKQVIILNCLDDCYGHMLLKLMNAQHHLQHQPEFGLIIIINRSLLWMVPEGVAEVWCVDAPYSQLNRQIKDMDSFIKNELQRFEKVFLSFAYMNLNFGKIDLLPFIHTHPFRLDQFQQLTPKITFVCRENRFWLTSKFNMLLYFAAVKYKFLKRFKSYFVTRQNRNIINTVKKLRKDFNKIEFAVVGVGKTGNFPSFIQDHRTQSAQISEETEKAWCGIFAGSHIVIGVHGSHMLIPTSLSAGFIDLLPDYKAPHLGEDTLLRSADRQIPFMQRHLHIAASAKLIATHAASMINHFYSHYHEASPETAEKFSDMIKSFKTY